MPGRIDETLQQPHLFQGSIQHESKREFRDNCTQQVKSEAKTKASADNHTVEVKSEVHSEPSGHMRDPLRQGCIQ